MPWMSMSIPPSGRSGFLIIKRSMKPFSGLLIMPCPMPGKRVQGVRRRNPEKKFFEKAPAKRESLIPEPIQASVFHPDPPRILGQVMGTYILAESEAGLLLIDQHAAHERIVYEALKKKLKISNMAGQSLMIPETVELTHRESDILLSLIPDLSILGIEVEPFGGTTFVI